MVMTTAPRPPTTHDVLVLMDHIIEASYRAIVYANNIIEREKAMEEASAGETD